MNETSPIAVFETRLPYLDRRALSQAWFDALHLARSQPGAPQSAPLSAHAVLASAHARLETAEPPSRDASFAEVRPSDATDPDVRGTRETGERRADRPHRPNVAARPRMPERRVRVDGPPRVANLTLAIGGARVQLGVVREHGKTRVVAVCAARHADAVRRALAGLDLALRIRGEEASSHVTSTDAC